MKYLIDSWFGNVEYNVKELLDNADEIVDVADTYMSIYKEIAGDKMDTSDEPGINRILDVVSQRIGKRYSYGMYGEKSIQVFVQFDLKNTLIKVALRKR